MWSHGLLLLNFVHGCRAVGQIFKRQSVAAPVPIVATPSESWDGIDGPWSTTHLHIGSPRQDLRVLVSTAGQETWVVLPQGCDGSELGNNCAGSRGRIFDSRSSISWQNASSVWNNSGIYQLGTVIGYDLGLTGNGLYGFDSVGLSWQTNNVTINHTIVAGIATDTYWLGQIGISPRPTNFTVTNDNSSSYTDPQPSFFSLLKDKALIPSLSYSFNPGSFYRSSSTRNAFASLIFGGFDASRYIPNQVKFGMNPDAGRELTVGLRTITKSDTAVDGSTVNSSLLTSGILARLDSSQPYIWLPIAACKLFEQAFGLSWDNATGMYLVNETLHHKLLSENATVVFGLTDGLQGTVSADITLPYGALDLQALPPLVNNAARYFPLKRTADESQYVLGRAFLQEAYLTVDYERNCFNVSQMLWNDTAVPDIRAIASVAAMNPMEARSGLATSAIVGIVLGILALLSMIVIALNYFHRWRRSIGRMVDASAIELDEDDKTRLQTAQSTGCRPWTKEESRKEGDCSTYDELDGTYSGKYEVSGVNDTVRELDDTLWGPMEVEGNYNFVEMDGRGRVAELVGTTPVYELHACPNR